MGGGLPDSALIAILVAAGYLAGSMPFGYWLVRVVKHDDIRRHGSGNIGATNVWRAYGRRLGLPVILLDVLKGLVPALVATLVAGDLAGVLAGGAAMLGHWRPLFLRFERGGKMVATAGGTLFGVAPLLAVATGVVWFAVFLLTRYASVASIVAAVSIPLLAWALGEPWPVIAFGICAAIGVSILHRANIRRLLDGTENRFELRRRRLPDRSPASATPKP
ncbi:MAG TPA: glycerol-3-phosphate 1-O-acyltransferase PlsY [Gaiellaceae bacterium]|jgi:glycerol-3-phosphate acyltransferase PlsY|nr:glycerol-3-phosphate 1-O-acyltransferase PlsY [Gaiellaceae bacterium]